MNNKILDPKVLGQLVLMQSVIINLPDKKSIFSFVCKGLLDIPGIAYVEFHECSPDKSEDLSLHKNYPITLGNSFFGELIVTFSKIELFEPYEHYLENFVFMIAVILEERNQRKINAQHQQLLEQRISERTQDLIDKNEEYQKINQELIISKEHAEESDRLKTAFLQNMSHEIRTPMNAIMGFSSLLKGSFDNKQKLEQFSEIINQRCNDLLEIINDILDISKIESGQLSVNTEEFNLHDLLTELSAFFIEYQKRINKQHIDFHILTPFDETEYFIITDKIKLKQIFINLITNALKFTDKGRIEGGCKFDEKQNLVFYVSDTGIGIPDDKQKVVFERFIQLNQDSRNIGGTGLGLSIAKGLVNLLGGKIFLKSEPGHGSTFSFTINYRTITSQMHSPTDRTINDAKDAINKTILIVEDDRYNALYLNEVLLDLGLQTCLAISGEEAVNISLTRSIDLVLMDINLPKMDGYEATRQIRKQKPELIIIAQTAFATPKDRLKALEAGCNDYLSKPTNPELLISTIRKYLS